MQRFKKHLMTHNNVNAHGEISPADHIAGLFRGFRIRGKQTPCNSYGKFVYGANGTLTQAARWRIAAIEMIDGMHAARHIGAWAMRNSVIGGGAGGVRDLLQSSREGGCRLP